MALEMRQRVVIGSATDLAKPTKDIAKTNSELILPFIRSAELIEERDTPISSLRIVIPPYPQEQSFKQFYGQTIRWEAGYWENGKPLYYGMEGSDGYHTEFEGVITAVSKRNYYDGRDAERYADNESKLDSLAVEIQALDYMYLYNMEKLVPPLSSAQKMPISELINKMISTSGINTKHGIKSKLLFNPTNVNPAGTVGVSADTPAMAFYTLRTRHLPHNKSLGLDIYFRLKDLIIRDPNDTSFVANGNYALFAEGWNVIESDLTPRQKYVTIKTRWYNADSGKFLEGTYPPIGSRENKNASLYYGGQTVKELVFDVDGGGSDQPPNLLKAAQDIYTSIAGDGLTGTFTTFGYPPVHRGEIIVYCGSDTDRQKAVIVNKVVKNYDAEKAEFRQHITTGFTPMLIVNPPLKSADEAITLPTRVKKQRDTAQKLESDIQRILSAIKSGGGL